MRMIKTTLLLALAATVVPAVALADSDRGDRNNRKGEGGPPATLTAPPATSTAVYIMRGSITAVTLPTITIDVAKANDEAAAALGLPKAPPVTQTVLLDANTKVLRTTRGRKDDHSRGKSGRGSTTDPASLAVGDRVDVKWMGAAGLTGATLATTPASHVFAKGAAGPKLVKFKVKAYVMSLPASGAMLPVTFLVDPFKVNANAAFSLNPTANPPVAGGIYNLAGTIPVIIDSSTEVEVRGHKGHWGHHRSGKGKWKLSRVKVGDRVEVEWKAPAGSKFWEVAAREAEFKTPKVKWTIVSP
jgi:hypothetical protein